jgi:hypothetical protein
MPASLSVSEEEHQMIGKITLTMALLIGTAAIAQQNQNNPTAPSNPTAPHTDPIQNLAECWDAATNRVRNPRTVGVNPGANPRAPQNQQSPAQASPANARPPGMKNC